LNGTLGLLVTSYGVYKIPIELPLNLHQAVTMAEKVDIRESDQEVTAPESSPTGSVRSSPARDADIEKVLSSHEQAQLVQQTVDPNIVGWDGDDDPEKPINWPAKKKWLNVMMVSGLTLLTPFGSSMLAPAVPQAMDEFNSTNVDLASFVVSVYVMGYVFGPLIIAPLSELYGRLWVYHINTFLFIIFNVGCALSTSLGMEFAFRFLAGFAGVAPLTVGSGTIADLFKQEERGKVMAMWTFPVLLGPTIGPVVGSYLGQAAGWRWDFWFLSIWAGVMCAAAVILQRETYPPVLLERKTKRLQKETGNMKLRSVMQSSKSPRQLFLLSIIRPTKMLFLSPIIFGLSLYITICYGYLYLVFTTITELFETKYHMSKSNVGLTFLGIGVGQFIGLFAFGSVSDMLLKKKAAKNGGEMKPEYRLGPLVPGGILMPVGLFMYGWTAQYEVHWILPIIGTGLIGMAMILVSLLHSFDVNC
jgi:multidrug resistance protein